MIKSELRKLRTLNATPAMMEKAKADDGSLKPLRSNSYRASYEMKRNYAYYMRCQQLGAYIKVAIFMPHEMKKGKTSPKFELFINPDGEEFITRYWKDGKECWSNAMLWNLPIDKKFNGSWSYMYYSARNAWMNQEGKETIKARLGVDKGGFEGIYQWQQRVRKNELEQKIAREVAPWDEDMALVPKVPKSFDRWWQKQVIKNNYIFYHYDRKEVKEGYCSYCEKEVPIKNPKHNKQGKCPRCHKEVLYKTDGKIATLGTDNYHCQLIQKVPDGVVIRVFRARKYYRDSDYRNPIYQAHEIRRTFSRDGIFDRYDWELYRNREHRWVRQSQIATYYINYGKVFTKNLTSLEKGPLKQSGLPIIARLRGSINVAKYLRDELYNPALEKLAKAGLPRLALNIQEISYDIALLDESATELAKMLRIDKARLKRLKNISSGISGLRWMQREKRENTIYPDEVIEFMDKHNISPRELNFIIDRMSEKQIYNYLIRQQKLLAIEPIQIIVKWRDYLNMAQKAGVQVSKELFYKPKDIAAAHDEMICLLEEQNMEKQAEELAKKWKNVNEVCKTLEKYEFQDDNFAIVAPKGIKDIIREGTVLRHCIHTCTFYFDRINTKEAYILFLRKTATVTTPWYTLEIEPGGNIRQKRTTGDNQNKDFQEAVSFLKKWQKEIKKRLTKEDKELAEKSNQARLENYKNLRENGNRIWHGRLQGQLLADVLEADFMEAI